MDSFKRLIFILFLSVSNIFFAIDEFYFVRHGQTDFNLKKEKKNWNMFLNDTGRLQIESLERSIKKLPIELIFFSPLNRAQETKNIINKYLQVSEISLPQIKEAKEGLYSEIIQLKNNTHNTTSKALKKFLSQISSGLKKILSCSKLPLVVGHGAVYAAICYNLNAQTDIWRIPNGCLVRFYINSDGVWNVELIDNGSSNAQQIFRAK